MIGDLYEYVKMEIIGEIPMEFEFIIAIIVIFIVILVLYVSFCGFIFLHDMFGGK